MVARASPIRPSTGAIPPAPPLPPKPISPTYYNLPERTKRSQPFSHRPLPPTPPSSPDSSLRSERRDRSSPKSPKRGSSKKRGKKPTPSFRNLFRRVSPSTKTEVVKIKRANETNLKEDDRRRTAHTFKGTEKAFKNMRIGRISQIDRK